MQHIFRIIEVSTFHPFHNTMANFNYILIFTFFSGTHPFLYGCGAQLTEYFTCLCRYIQFLWIIQALRPITNKWIQLSVINTFDPIIFTVLCIGIVLWVVGLHPLADLLSYNRVY